MATGCLEVGGMGTMRDDPELVTGLIELADEAEQSAQAVGQVLPTVGQGLKDRLLPLARDLARLSGRLRTAAERLEESRAGRA